MISPNLCITILVCILTAVYCETEHHWEWVGLFEIDSHTMNPTWILDYQIDTIEEFKVVVLESPSNNEGELESLEKDAEALFAAGNVLLNSQFASVGAVHKYTVSKDSWAKMISFSFSNAGYYALFFDIHVDDYCRAEGECFKNPLGDSVHMHWEHSVEHDHSEDHSENASVRWAQTLEACVIVWTAVFAGVVLLGGGCRKYESVDPAGVTVEYLNMFAAGALLGTAFCLVLTEASHMIATGTLPAKCHALLFSVPFHIIILSSCYSPYFRIWRVGHIWLLGSHDSSGLYFLRMLRTSPPLCGVCAAILFFINCAWGAAARG
jgi:hypothetical protein